MNSAENNENPPNQEILSEQQQDQLALEIYHAVRRDFPDFYDDGGGTPFDQVILGMVQDRARRGLSAHAIFEEIYLYLESDALVSALNGQPPLSPGIGHIADQMMEDGSLDNPEQDTRDGAYDFMQMFAEDLDVDLDALTEEEFQDVLSTFEETVSALEEVSHRDWHDNDFGEVLDRTITNLRVRGGIAMMPYAKDPEAVRQWLIEQGIDPSLLTVENNSRHEIDASENPQVDHVLETPSITAALMERVYGGLDDENMYVRSLSMINGILRQIGRENIAADVISPSLYQFNSLANRLQGDVPHNGQILVAQRTDDHVVLRLIMKFSDSQAAILECLSNPNVNMRDVADLAADTRWTPDLFAGVADNLVDYSLGLGDAHARDIILITLIDNPFVDLGIKTRIASLPNIPNVHEYIRQNYPTSPMVAALPNDLPGGG